MSLWCFSKIQIALISLIIFLTLNRICHAQDKDSLSANVLWNNSFKNVDYYNFKTWNAFDVKSNLYTYGFIQNWTKKSEIYIRYSKAEILGYKENISSDKGVYISKFNENGELVKVYNPKVKSGYKLQNVMAACNDSDMNIFMYGEFKYEGKRDSSLFYLSKFSRKGKKQWVKTIKCNSKGNRLHVSSLCNDEKGDLYVAITYLSGQFQIENEVNINIKDRALIILKYDPKGKLLWTQIHDGVDAIGDYSKIISMKYKDGLFILGRYTGTQMFNQRQMYRYEEDKTLYTNHNFLLHLDLDGKFKSSIELTANYYSDLTDFAFDNEDNLLLVGGFTGKIYFSNKTISLEGNPKVNYLDICIIKFSRSGELLNFRQINKPGTDHVYKIIIDQRSDIYLNCSLSDSSTTTNFDNQMTAHNYYRAFVKDNYILKINNNLSDIAYLKFASNFENDQFLTDNKNNFCISGYYKDFTIFYIPEIKKYTDQIWHNQKLLYNRLFYVGKIRLN